MRENTFMYHDYTIQGRCWEFPLGPVDPWDEALEMDRELFPPVHIHVSRESSDCDGAHGDYYVMWPEQRDNMTAEDVRIYVREQQAEMLGSFDVDKFWRRAVSGIVDYSPEYGGTLEILKRDGGEYDLTAEWSQRTNEGGVSVTLDMCTDHTCDTRHTVYDQYAEMAGY